MDLKNRIIDYDANKSEADKWLKLKGVAKYEMFADILKKNNIEITWKKIDDLVKYDKRLLIRIFKYLSFYEDYLRALIWNIDKSNYKKLEDSFLKDIIKEVLKNKNQLNNEIEFNKLKFGKIAINNLRNSVSHNKIMLNFSLDNLTLKQALIYFKDALPKDYQNGFKKDINGCVKKLDIDERIKIII